MASEIRVNSLTNRSGLSTVTIADTGVVVAGIVTASTFSGPLTGDVTGNVTGNTSGTATNLTGSPSITVTDITATGNLIIGGVLTYDDVTNVDSVGIVTARTGINVTGGHIDLVDNSRIRVGTGDDLEIYHNGTHSYIKNATGNLYFQHGGENMAQFSSDGNVELYYDNSKKLETTTTGAKVSGALEVTQEYPSIRPTLDLNFAATKTLDRRITFTRDSLGTFTDDMGIVKYAPNNVPRFDHDPTTGESLGLLIEESRTNLVEYGDFTTGWSEFGGAATSTTETAAPDGTFTAKKITSKGDQSTSGIYDAINYSANTTYTHTMWLKAGTVTIAGITVNSGGKWASSNYPYITVNLSTGAVTASGGVSAKATAYPNGWYRLEATGTFAGNTQVDAIWVHSQTGSSMSGNTTGYYYVWGPQAEQGSFATSYIPTTGSTVTRSQDTAKITGTNFTDFYNKDEGTLFVNYKLDKANYLYSPVGVELVVFKADDNSGRYSVRVVSDTSAPQLDAHGVDGSTAQFDVVGIHLSDGLKDYFVAKAFKLNDMATSFNGAAPQTDTSVTVVEWDKLLIGTDPKRAHYKSVKYYPKRLPNAQLQGLTQQ